MPKVTLIVAIYNSEKYLPKLIDSIINQTYKNLEIILVDDGSPDNCPQICDNYAKKDNRIKVIHKKNGGTCEARNYGLAQTTGDYVSIIDGDDWLEPDYVEYFMSMIKKSNSDMAMSLNVFTTRNRDQVNQDKIEVWSNEKAAINIIYPVMPIGPWNKMYKVSMLKKHNINFNIPWSGEGLYFASMAAEYSNHVAVGRRKVYNYRLNNADSGLTHYKIVMGTNALWNIRNIKKVSVVKTSELSRAINWHIWKNNYFVIFLIVATDSKNKKRKLYKKCLHYLRKNLYTVLVESDSNYIGKKAKMSMLLHASFPTWMAKREVAKARKALLEDTMN
ncbi:glycosyltransferase family 2 protein [Lactobacillus amylovorus subsp. animalium]|uniref:glycosyltransferase family 2 protein n=1 Tax=Lactobacillus amylovorus TaxID=1604 RepID=UPI0010AD98A1|nr:glycosyltransferase family 2 protein [Lactobacillus amylovorus]TJY02324.1 glycosyltransferase family 2 protein [Lactobacillus amylovorus]